MKKYFVAFLFLTQAPLASATNVYDTEADFLARLQPNYYLKDFNGDTFGNPFYGNPSQISETYYDPVSGYSWTASAPLALYSITDALSTNNPFDPLTITLTGSSPVTAVGGIFASTYMGGLPSQQLVTITLSLSDGTDTTVFFNGLGFRGFTTATPTTTITKLTIDVSDDPDDGWPGLYRFYVGLAIPEPTSLALLGLGGLLLVPWRRYTRG